MEEDTPPTPLALLKEAKIKAYVRVIPIPISAQDIERFKKLDKTGKIPPPRRGEFGYTLSVPSNKRHHPSVMALRSVLPEIMKILEGPYIYPSAICKNCRVHERERNWHRVMACACRPEEFLFDDPNPTQEITQESLFGDAK